MQRGARIVITVLLATVVALATALAVTAARNLQNGPPGPAAATVQVQVDPAAAGYSLPSLNAEQKQQVRDLALADPHILRLTRGQSPQGAEIQAQDVIVWHKSGGELLGGVVTLTFAQPVTVEGEWLALAYDCNEEANRPGKVPYGRVPFQAKYTGVKELMVFVDLPRRQVAGIAPNRGARLEGSITHAPGVARPTGTACHD